MHRSYIYCLINGPFARIIYLLLFVSCHTSQQGLFGKRTPHEKYRNSLVQAGLDNTRLGKLWIQASDKSLKNPLRVTIPYKETGYFEMNAPDAAGYIFAAARGDQVTIRVSTNPNNGILLFTELWQPAQNDQPKFLAAADTATGNINYEITKEGLYIVRIQPELLQGLAYTLTITTAPSLAFPVHKTGNPRIISFWGANRDAGARLHEGVDIQAPKLTPTVAVAGGIITNVSENKLGGKVVFLRPSGKKYSLYYAHLDQQLVHEGQVVNTGDTIGLIGNTGNAIHTAPHLHFGIYTTEGAVDPLPFINPSRPEPKDVQADTANVTKYARVKTNTTLYRELSRDPSGKTIIPKNNIFKIKAAADQLYKVQLPDSTVGFVSSAAITDQPLQKQRLSQALPLFNMPDSNAAVKTQLQNGVTITLLGAYKNYYLTEWQNNQGWIQKPETW